MKQVFTLSFLLISLVMFPQQKSTTAKPAKATTTTTTTVTTQPVRQETPVNPRAASTSAQVQSKEAAPLPYDVNDKYMGRKNEFLNSMIVSELPADFPAYEKQWNLKEYNQVVDAYFSNHRDLLKDRVREKISQQYPKN